MTRISPDHHRRRRRRRFRKLEDSLRKAVPPRRNRDRERTSVSFQLSVHLILFFHRLHRGGRRDL